MFEGSLGLCSTQTGAEGRPGNQGSAIEAVAAVQAGLPVCGEGIRGHFLSAEGGANRTPIVD